MKPSRLLRSCVLVGLVTACASGTPNSEPAPDAGPVTMFARVQNQNQFDAMIYTYWNGQWGELGQVPAGEVRILPFTWVGSQVRFVIELIYNDAVTDLSPEDDSRVTYAADALRSIPCHLSGRNDVEPNLTLMLTVSRELSLNGGSSRCQRRER